jgi:hypothetical protein
MSDTIQSAEELISNIRDCDYMEGDWSLTTNDAIKAIEARDTAIRADEAEKQSDKMRAFFEAAEYENIDLFINLATVGDYKNLGEKTKKRIKEKLAAQPERYAACVEAAKAYLIDHSCAFSGHCNEEESLRNALADLEAPK